MQQPGIAKGWPAQIFVRITKHSSLFSNPFLDLHATFKKYLKFSNTFLPAHRHSACTVAFTYCMCTLCEAHFTATVDRSKMSFFPKSCPKSRLLWDRNHALLVLRNTGEGNRGQGRATSWTGGQRHCTEHLAHMPRPPGIFSISCPMLIVCLIFIPISKCYCFPDNVRVPVYLTTFKHKLVKATNNNNVPEVHVHS